MKGEAVVAVSALPFGAGEGVLGLGLRVEEDRKVAPDRAKAPGQHVFRGGADDHVVAVLDRPAEQRITNRAADGVDLHAALAARSVLAGALRLNGRR
jgi:hypothetical protein